jgi:branched-subunit amino acid permease
MKHQNIPSVTSRSLLRLLVLLAGICVLAGLVGAVVEWVGTYLVPVVMILVVVILVVALVMWAVERLPEPPNRDRLQ